MPHVSFNKLADGEKKALYRSLVKALEKSFSDRRGFEVLQEFLTRTEREMLAKRFAVIALLKREVPASKIANVLKMSRVTIDTMAVKYEAGKYDKLIQAALREKNVMDILEDVFDKLNTAGGLLPPRIKRRSKSQ